MGTYRFFHRHATFADLGATLADLFSVTMPRAGASFLRELRA